MDVEPQTQGNHRDLQQDPREGCAMADSGAIRQGRHGDSQQQRGGWGHSRDQAGGGHNQGQDGSDKVWRFHETTIGGKMT